MPFNTYQSRTLHTVHHFFFLLYVATIQQSNHSRQKSESKKHNLHFIFLTHMWLWNKVKVIKPAMKMLNPSKVIIMQSLKDLALTVSKKKAMLKCFFPKEEVCHLSPLNMCEKKGGLFMIQWKLSLCKVWHLLHISGLQENFYIKNFPTYRQYAGWPA